MTDHAAQRAHYEAQVAIAEYPRVRALLAEARAALGPEFCGPPNSLAGRIDDALHGVQGEPVLGSLGDVAGCDEPRGLTWERLPSGEPALLRAPSQADLIERDIWGYREGGRW